MTTSIPSAGRRGRNRASRLAERRALRPSRAVHPGLLGGTYKPLSEHDLKQVTDTALRILADIGISEVTDEILQHTMAKGAHLNSHGRLCFPRALVEDVIAHAANEIVYHGRDPARTICSGGNRVYFATAGEAVRFVDPNTGEYRPSTLFDLYDFFRMGDFLEHIDFCGQQVVATDICEDAQLHAMNIAYAGAAATTKPFGISLADASTVATVESLWDTVLGAPGAFRHAPFATIGVCPIVSPLRFGPDTSAVLCEAARRGLPISACSAPQAGATAPAALAGALAQCTAEALAIVTLVNLINPGGPVDFGPWTFVSDLRTGAFTGGGGEEAILQAAAGQIARYLRLPGVVAAGMTDSKRPDYQAGYEKGMTIALSALAGGNMICECAGMMGSLFGCSLESMVMDNDLIGAVQRSLRGIEVTEETLSFDLIEQTVLGPCHFLGTAQTLAMMETEYLYPKVGDRSSLSEWQYRGSPELMTAARARVREIMGRHYPDNIAAHTDSLLRSSYDIRLPRDVMRPNNDRWSQTLA
ncbi:MAG: trimethylamine methyltransferase family protein [Steroidobacteraceae bacterium]